MKRGPTNLNEIEYTATKAKTKKNKKRQNKRMNERVKEQPNEEKNVCALFANKVASSSNRTFLFSSHTCTVHINFIYEIKTNF